MKGLHTISLEHSYAPRKLYAPNQNVKLQRRFKTTRKPQEIKKPRLTKPNTDDIIKSRKVLGKQKITTCTICFQEKKHQIFINCEKCKLRIHKSCASIIDNKLICQDCIVMLV